LAVSTDPIRALDRPWCRLAAPCHWLSFLLLVLFWWLLHAHRTEPRRRAWPILQWTTVILVLLVIVARLWQVLATIPPG